MALMPAANYSHGRTSSALIRLSRNVLLIAVLMFVAALVGSLTRPTGFLAAFWPANAVLAGLLVRNRQFRRLSVLFGAVAGYVGAAFIVGDQFHIGLLLTAANLSGVLSFVLLFGALDPLDRQLARPQGVLFLLVIAAGSSAVSAFGGAMALGTLFGTPLLSGWMLWFAADLVNYLAILPVILTAPRLLAWLRPWRLPAGGWLLRAAPVALLMVAIAASAVFAHPIALVFPLPALIWCALALPLFGAALTVMAYSAFVMVGIILGLFDLGSGGLDAHAILATHIGAALLALGPLAVASVSSERRRQIGELERLARYDSLTDALTRSAFFDRANGMIASLARRTQPVAVLLIDADHFKQINDTHGHQSGDRVLVAVAGAIRGCIRDTDLFGRLGGEEFALLLPAIAEDEAEAAAERIRRAVANLGVVLDNGTVQLVTISVGLAYAGVPGRDFGELIALADNAMYEAKRAGRNRVAARRV